MILRHAKGVAAFHGTGGLGKTSPETISERKPLRLMKLLTSCFFPVFSRHREVPETANRTESVRTP